MTEQTKKQTIKEWASDDRPREKMMLKGIDSLSNAELLAILIGSGNRNETAVELCQKILKQVDNNLHELGKQSIDDLMKHKGIGEAKAITIVAALELGRRRKVAEVLKKPMISGSQAIFELMQPAIGDLPHEEFWVILLNQAMKIIDKVRISQGGVNSTVIDVRLIMKRAIEKLATSMIVCHNHPSGSTKPSDQDKLITYKIKDSGDILDIKLLDHVIICQNAYLSFADEGLI